MPTRATEDSHQYFRSANMTGMTVDNQQQKLREFLSSHAWLNQIPLRLIRLSAPTLSVRNNILSFPNLYRNSLSLSHTQTGYQV